MSQSQYNLKPSNAGIYQINALNVNSLSINGIPFEQFINDLVIEDQFEQEEIEELKLLLQYLNTSGLSSEWIVDNNNKNQDLKTLITQIQSNLGNVQGNVSILQGNVSILQGNVSILQGNVSTLESNTQYLKAPYNGLGISPTSYFLNGLQVWNGDNESNSGIFSYKNGSQPANQIELRAENGKSIKLSGDTLFSPVINGNVKISNGTQQFKFIVGNGSNSVDNTSTEIYGNVGLYNRGGAKLEILSTDTNLIPGAQPNYVTKAVLEGNDEATIRAELVNIRSKDDALIRVNNGIRLFVEGTNAIDIQAGECGLNETSEIRIGTEQDNTDLGFKEIYLGKTNVIGRNTSTFLDGDTYFPINPVNPELYDYLMYVGMPTVNSGALRGQMKTTFNPYFRSISTFSASPTINSFIQSSGLFNVAVGLGGISLASGLGGTAITCLGGLLALTALAGGINIQTASGLLNISTGAGLLSLQTGVGSIEMGTTSGDIIIDSGSKGDTGSTYITPKDYLALNPQKQIIIGENGNKPIYGNLIDNNYTATGNLFTTSLNGNVIYSNSFYIDNQPTFLRPVAFSQLVLNGNIAPQEFIGNTFMRLFNKDTGNNIITSDQSSINYLSTKSLYVFSTQNGNELPLPNNANIMAEIIVSGNTNNYQYNTWESNANILGNIGVSIFNVVKPSAIDTPAYVNIFGNVYGEGDIDTIANIRLFSNVSLNETKITNTSVQTKAVILDTGYGGSTTNALYNINGSLYFNNSQVGGGGNGGGIDYFIIGSGNINVNPSPNPSTLFAVSTYNSLPQYTITQEITATGTGLLTTRYTTEIFNKEANITINGVNRLSQYIKWSQNNTVGQIYGQTYFQSYATNDIIWDKKYTNPQSTTGQVLNGTPIVVPLGLISITFQKVIFSNIDIDGGGSSLNLKCRFEQNTGSGYTVISTSSATLILSSAFNQTIIFNETFTKNQTTTAGAPIEYRMVLFIHSGTGTITSNNAGGADLVGYAISGGEGTTANIRMILYDGVTLKTTIPNTATPYLQTLDLPIATPFDASNYNFSRLSFDIFVFQPSGAANQNHIMTFYFNDGAISHIETVIKALQNIPTLATVLTSGNIASTGLNMNNNSITNVSSIQNYNVKEIVAGSGVSVSPNNGSYTIAVSGAGSGAAIKHTDEAIIEVAAQPRKPSYWSTNWTVADNSVRNHFDIYCSVDGKIIQSVSSALRRSTDYGVSWSNYTTVESIGANMEWDSITGSSNGDILYALLFNEDTGTRRVYRSLDQGFGWSILHTLPNGIIPNRIRCSGDGVYILLDDTSTKANGAHYRSLNSGTTWSVKTVGTPNTGSTNGICMSRNGAIQYIIFRDTVQSIIYRTYDYGENWTAQKTVPRVVDIEMGFLTSLECDAMGKFVYATRFLGYDNPTLQGYRSSNYGDSWSELPFSPLINVNNIWVSGTGQFVVATSLPIEVPVVGSVNVFYSIDYGRSFNSVGLGVPTSSCIAGSSNGEILVIASKTTTEDTYTGDGKIRIARELTMQQTINESRDFYPWANTRLFTNQNASHLWSFNFTNQGGIIDLNQYNIRYEFDCNWNDTSFTGNPTQVPISFPLLVLNTLSTTDSVLDGPNAQTATTNWSLTMNDGNIINEINQMYRGKCYTGFVPLSTDGIGYRNRTLMKGELAMNFRTVGETLFTDPVVNARMLVNNFTCDNYLTEKVTDTEWSVFVPATQGLTPDFQHQRVHGSSLWELTAGNLWSGFSSGIHTIGFKLMTNVGNNIAFRAGEVKMRIWRIRKQ